MLFCAANIALADLTLLGLAFSGRKILLAHRQKALRPSFLIELPRTSAVPPRIASFENSGGPCLQSSH